MITTIQVSVELAEELKARKMLPRESYEDIIRSLLEDSKQLNEETLKDIEKSRAEIKAGKYYSLDDLKKEL